MEFKNIRLIGIVVGVAILLLIPLVAMRFTDEVDWDIFDFAVMGTLLLGAGLACEFVLRMVQSTGQRIVMCLSILAALIVIWAELAVGIFGSPFAGS